jgi:hypothetical protein
MKKSYIILAVCAVLMFCGCKTEESLTKMTKCRKDADCVLSYCYGRPTAIKKRFVKIHQYSCEKRGIRYFPSPPWIKHTAVCASSECQVRTTNTQTGEEAPFISRNDGKS